MKVYWEHSLSYGKYNKTGSVRLETAKWRYLGSGAYNVVSISLDKIRVGNYIGHMVFKKHNHEEHFLSEYHRAVRKWNILNPTYPAFLVKKGWVAPYLGNETPTDEEIANKVLAIYKNDRTIIVDSYVTDNFRKFNGDIFCIDVDFALRRGSVASERQIRDGAGLMFEYLNKYRSNAPLTILVTSALLWLEISLPPKDIKDEYLSGKALMAIDLLSRRKVKVTKAMMEQLLLFMKLDPTHKIKLEAIVPLLSLNLKFKITPTLLTRLKFFVSDNPSEEDPYNGIDVEYMPYLLEPERVRFEGIIQKYTHAIHVAAKLGLLEEVKAFIRLSPGLAHVKDEYNQTPLLWAAASGHDDIVAYLLEKKVHLNPQTNLDLTDERFYDDNMLTPLDWAIKNNHIGVVDLLKSSGALTLAELGRKVTSAKRGLQRYGFHTRSLSFESTSEHVSLGLTQ